MNLLNQKNLSKRTVQFSKYCFDLFQFAYKNSKYIQALHLFYNQYSLDLSSKNQIYNYTTY